MVFDVDDASGSQTFFRVWHGRAILDDGSSTMLVPTHMPMAVAAAQCSRACHQLSQETMQTS